MNKVKKQWKMLKKNGIKVVSLKQWARSAIESGGDWAGECRAWLKAKGRRV